MLAIIWALNSLRNYLYGTDKITIYTDHQPLTYALSNKNNNSKLKRWKAILEEYHYEIKYKPGKANVVADALSRPFESSSHNLIPTINSPINVFKNQIWILTDQIDSYQFKIPFPTYHRHILTKPNYSIDDLTAILKRYLNPSVINGIFTTEKIMGQIQQIYPLHFKNYKARYTQTQVKDLITNEQQENEILRTHKRAHRNPVENKQQLIETFYFPKMLQKIKAIVKQCGVCAENKYDRHPNNPKIQATPIPEYPGQIIHIDIYITGKTLILTAIDKYSKYAQAKILKSRATEDIREPLRQIIFNFGVPQNIIIDNEKSLNSNSITFLLEDQLRIKIYKIPPHTSTANGQVERFHSTLSEILRCLKSENTERSFEELLDRAVYEYNYSIQTTTGQKPIESFFGRRIFTNPDQYEEARQNNIQRIKQKQEKDLIFHNKNRSPFKEYKIGLTIYVRINKRYGNKLTSRYKEEIVKENKNSTVLTQTGKVVHKSLIKSKKKKN
uniref:RNA-directed DNA polymerase n=1 Tax=Bactrocera latifrons TaxID=174628 RepID=A0A0K8VRD0_BACLA